MIVKNFINIFKFVVALLLFAVVVFGLPYIITSMFTTNEQIRLGVMYVVGYAMMFILVMSVIISIE